MQLLPTDHMTYISPYHMVCVFLPCFILMSSEFTQRTSQIQGIIKVGFKNLLFADSPSQETQTLNSRASVTSHTIGCET